MAVLFYLLVTLYVVNAAPPSQHYPHAVQIQVNPLDYYLDSPQVANYYQQEPRPGNSNAAPNNAPARLELVDPDSEVELIPGAQQPQQPPQQNPVAPNIPGLIPGQRVFIVHMPVPGIRPGTIGGYQPVYVVAAAPQPNAGNAYPGYQNPVLLGPSGQPISPVYGYQTTANGVQGSPNYLLGPPVNRPFHLSYQEPVAYQPIQKDQGSVQQGAVRLSQLVALQGQQPQTTNEAKQNNEGASNTEPQSARQVTLESKEQTQNVRPSQSQRKV
ncbi:unnamed protein product, partial [Brenthis ino]